MAMQLTGKNIELTPKIRQYVDKKLGKLNRHLPEIIDFSVEITEEKTRSPQHQFVVRATVDGSGTRLHSEERGEDLFNAIDKVAAVMTRQAERYKGKLYEKGKGNSFARNNHSEETEKVRPVPEVVKVKRFAVKPMTITEAADQMELLHHDFFLFYNAEAEEVNLLYRRRDGNYGLIEPEMG